MEHTKRIDRKPKHPLPTKVLVAVAGLAIAGGVGAKVADSRAHNALPACEVPARNPGDNASTVRHELKERGGDVRANDRAEIWTPGPDSRQRTRELDPTLHGSIVVQPGDIIRLEHAKPEACLEVGGFIDPPK